MKAFHNSMFKVLRICDIVINNNVALVDWTVVKVHDKNHSWPNGFVCFGFPVRNFYTTTVMRRINFNVRNRQTVNIFVHLNMLCIN